MDNLVVVKRKWSFPPQKSRVFYSSPDIVVRYLSSAGANIYLLPGQLNVVQMRGGASLYHCCLVAIYRRWTKQRTGVWIYVGV